ncbi:MAG: hypothetical protein V1929_13880 [bacterium]
MRFLRQIACATVLMLLVTSAVAAAIPSDPDQVQLDAYTAVVHGDQARDRGDWKNAVRSYRDAATFYKRLAADAPQWHPDIVQYRLTYCANEIAAIAGRSGRTEAELLAAPDADVPASTNEIARRVNELSSQNDALRAELDRLNQEIQARPANDSRDADVRRFKGEVAGLQAQLAGMSNELAQVSPTNGNLVASLRADHERLQAELEKARKHSIALRETIDLQEKELKKVDELRTRVDSLKGERDRLYAEMKKARNELDHALQEKRVMKLEALVTNLRVEVKMARDEEEKLRERIATLEKENAWLKRK